MTQMSGSASYLSNHSDPAVEPSDPKAAVEAQITGSASCPSNRSGPAVEPSDPKAAVEAQMTGSASIQSNRSGPVFSPEQIEAIVAGDFRGIPDSKYVDMEDRMHPLCPADMKKQMTLIQEAKKGPSATEIAETLSRSLGRELLTTDSELLTVPAEISDPAHWQAWFETTLNSCEEAKRANRDFKDVTETSRWSPHTTGTSRT